MKQAKKNNVIKIAAVVWTFVAAIDTAGLVELLPEDFKGGQWIKFGVAFLLVVFGMFGYKKAPTTDI